MAAFLRNTHDLLQGIAKFRRSSMELLDNALAIFALILIGTQVLVIPAEAHGVVEQNGDLTCRSSYRFGLSNAGSEPAIESAQRGAGPSDRDRRQAQVRGQSVGRFPRPCRQHFSAADLAARRKCQP